MSDYLTKENLIKVAVGALTMLITLFGAGKVAEHFGIKNWQKDRSLKGIAFIGAVGIAITAIQDFLQAQVNKAGA